MQTRVINKVKVKPLILEQPDLRPVQGGDLFPTLYSNIAIVSRKKSGKTHLIGNILDHCAGRSTSVIIICPTVRVDLSYKTILQSLKKRKINTLVYDDLLQDGVSVLDELIETLQQPDAQPEIKKQEKTLADSMFGTNKVRLPRKKVSRLKSHDFIIIIDDSSHNLRDPSVSRLVKVSRHFHVKLILSTQNTTDISPSSWRNIDSVIIFKGMTVDKLFRTYELMDIHVPFELFLRMYNQAVSEPFQFLNVDCRLDTYRLSFNREFILPYGL